MSNHRWDDSGERVGEALISKDVGPEAMEDIMKVMFLGGGDVEGRNGNGKKKKDDENGQQAKSNQLDEFQQASQEFVPPAFNPNTWAQTLKISTRLARCVRSYARNTVGLGWHIEPIHPVTPETEKKEKKTIEEQTEILRSLFMHPNEKMPFSEICYLVKVDEESTGNGYLEVVRNNSGKIVKLYHAPATTMRRRVMKGEDGREQIVYGYLQIRNNRKRYFKEFGDRRVMDAEKGEFYEGAKVLPSGKRATEILHFLIYDPTSSYYGAPRYVSASTAIAGNRQAAIRNVSFFENDAVPRMALLISGGRLAGESVQQIEDFIRGKGHGADQAHRVMVIQVEPTKVGFQQQGKAMVELKPLTVGVTEDQSFGAYRKDNDEEVREIFGMHPIFFTGDNVNKASATVGREITNEQEFEPDRLSKEYTINQTIVADLLTEMFGNDNKTPDDDEQMMEYRKNIRVQFRFARLTLTDPLDQARMDQIYGMLGAITPNEMRERLNKAPYPKDYFFADKPLSIALAELSAGLALAIAQQEDEKFPEGMAGAGGPVQGMPGGVPGGAADGEGGGKAPLPGGVPGAKAPKMKQPVLPHPATVKFREGIEVVGAEEIGDVVVTVAPKKKKLPFSPEKGFAIAQQMLMDASALAQAGSHFARGGTNE